MKLISFELKFSCIYFMLKEYFSIDKLHRRVSLEILYSKPHEVRFLEDPYLVERMFFVGRAHPS